MCGGRAGKEGKMRKKAKLTNDTIRAICELRKKGWTYGDLMTEFGIGNERLMNILQENNVETKVYQTQADVVPLTYAKPRDTTPERVMYFGKRYLDVTKEFFERNDRANGSLYFEYSPQMEGAFSFSY